MIRVLICGSRTWHKPGPIRAFVYGLAAQYDGIVVIEGEADGADRMAADAAGDCASFGMTVERYPAQWDVNGRAAGPIRNQQMLDEGRPDVVFAFVDRPLDQSRGTADMVRRARAAGLPVYVTEAA